ncbi:ATP synthase subunit gamma, mitochondrial [Beauveria bassiana]|uniref:ATP synthase subunit gamma n=1 Tax=Beauveria bassiana (strain ARSEF 2860) TaxID=655819 RepID=J4UVE1_BEAB2|nr:ATP synthase subunit gamma precursor [Beauveria bassiana ARSEF 2860]EJP70107.1 ATP synthase subunit gamma precursor [Beauveria bassiana ARSEF 2860]KAF1731616.1 ATP synthase subunit gamma, mitochondrial [Beauveria bassiana]KAH8715845.1 ATP synthase subunit gamma, mitochondrial [Beauveria bassiana]
MLSRAARPAVRAAVTSTRVAPAGPSSAATYATLREIEGRLKSIKNIQKITSTMKIVASTKLTRATRSMNDSRTYGATSNEVFKQAETAALNEGEKKTLVIVCSSDKGLCGAIHSGMSRFLRRLQAEGEQFDLAIIGEKCRAQLSRTSAESIQLSFAGVGKDIPTFADAQAIADQIIMLPKDYTDVKILYNRFINASSYEPTFIEAFSEEAILASPNISSFEVDDSVLENLREYSLANSLYWALAEGHACEQSARRNAMDNASKNAGEMISKYQILYNRTRQAVITGELVEIITGATASEDM